MIYGTLMFSFILAYDWNSLPEGSKVVDVRGGIGTISKVLADSQTHLKIVVQDRPTVVADGLAVCSCFLLGL